MTYNTKLENRIDNAIASWANEIPKKKMFSGVGYFLNGNMVCGIHKDELIVRADPKTGDELLTRSGIRPFQMGMRVSMRGWYLVGGEAIANTASLNELLTLSRDYVMTLSPKVK